MLSKNVNDSFFDGCYANIWRNTVPNETTSNELRFLVNHFNLTSDHQVLDLMSGYGRHAIELSRKGIKTTVVDNLYKYINELEAIKVSENLPMECICSDVLKFSSSRKFDLAICMGNSLNFFDENDSFRLMSSVAKKLKANGSFIINSYCLAESAIKNFSWRSWYDDGNYKILVERKYLLRPARIESKFTFIHKDGMLEVKDAIDYIFSLSEMERMLEKAGFFVSDVFSILGEKVYEFGHPVAYIFATRK